MPKLCFLVDGRQAVLFIFLKKERFIKKKMQKNSERPDVPVLHWELNAAYICGFVRSWQCFKTPRGRET